MRHLGTGACFLFSCVFGVMSCCAGEPVDTRLKDDRVGDRLGERLEMPKLAEKPAEEMRESGQIRRSSKQPNVRVGAKIRAKRLRREKTKRVVAGLR